ncbi:MAG: SIMPL domain-containing protein [Mycobacterium sp.]|jgi:uncharacterized protein YggE|nr:SIMPL domain-containing protein [Mycobacterium sp.]
MPIAGRVTSLLRLSIVLLVGLMVATLSACDVNSTPPPPGQNPRQVTVVGNGEVDGTPDTLTANVAITFVATDVTGAMNQVSDRQQAVIDALVNAGVDRKDIATSNVSLQSQYASNGTDITGFQATNALNVTIRDLSTASRVLALIVSTGGDATRINSVNFSINDDSQLVKDARTRAFNDAKDRAQQYADLSGLKLGKVISISEVAGATPPPPQPMPYRGGEAAMASVPVEPGQQTVSFQVTAVWELG